MRRAIASNCTFFDELLATFGGTCESDLDHRPSHLVGGEEEANKLANEGYAMNPGDEDKVKYILKNLARDWSDEGRAEREECYAPVMRALQRSCPPPAARGVSVHARAASDSPRCDGEMEIAGSGRGVQAHGSDPMLRSDAQSASFEADSFMDVQQPAASGGGGAEVQAPPRCVVAGAGLGRLCCELAGLGYEAQGNEYSYYMLLASSFVLNHCRGRYQWNIHPWVHQTCNVVSDEDQTRCVRIPDMTPGEIACRVSPGLLSMCAGDFVEVYKQPEQKGAYDAVVTCFFVDTAHNVLEYLDVVHYMLKSGGVWVNHGPLLYHWADAHEYLQTDELSVEISLEAFVHAAEMKGFQCIEKEILPSSYTSNVRSMMKTIYYCGSWTMIKQPPKEAAHE